MGILSKYNDQNIHSNDPLFFQGVEIPGPVFYLLLDGDINKTDLAMMALIKCLSKFDRKTRKWTHCYATDAALGETLHLQVRQVSRTLTKLRRDGLIHIYYKTWKGRRSRYIQVTWYEGIHKENEETEQESPSLTETSEHKLPSLPETSDIVSGRLSHIREANEESHTPVDSGSAHADPCQPESDPVNRIQSFTENKNSNGNHKVNSSSGNPVASRLTDKLIDILLSSGKLMRSTSERKKWIPFMVELLICRSEEQIDAALDWYRKHIKDDYVPECYSTKSLLEKFTKLESAMERKNKENKPKEGFWRYGRFYRSKDEYVI